MSFSFDFSGDDIEYGEQDTQDLIPSAQQHILTQEGPSVPPKLHSFKDLLQDLPSQLSYNILRLHDGLQRDILIPRRSVFDIRTQLMAEANPEDNNHDSLLAGLDRGDLSSGVYEGGFKTWECALDLAGLVAHIDLQEPLPTHIIEMGAGSAIPSLAMLRNKLSRPDLDRQKHLHLTLCDYNEDVLRLATAPNVFLMDQVLMPQSGLPDADLDSEVEDIDDARISASIEAWHSNNVTLDFISGAWGDEFTSIVQDTCGTKLNEDTHTLILASETIYSPASTTVFVKSLMQLLQINPQRSRAWIAAKKIYFGVGGSIDDFTNEVRNHNGCLRTILDVQGAGVGRVVLEVTANRGEARKHT